MDIKENVKQVIEEIKTIIKENYITKDINICAATKYVDIKEMNELINAGIVHLGENRVDDFLRKKAMLSHEKIEWHFIGSLQTNKVSKMINEIDYLHSLDRESLAKEINKTRNEPLKCFIEVNCSEEASKHGLKMSEVKSFVELLKKYDKIRVIGLMTMAEHTSDEMIIRQTFRKLKGIQEEIISLNLDYCPCNHLSMGMSNDYLLAIEEGATFVRIGSRLFK